MFSTNRNIARSVAIVLAVIGVASCACASIELNVGQSVGNSLGVSAIGGWSDSSSTMTGAVERLGNSFRYTYTFTAANSPDISHMIIEASPMGVLLPFGQVAGDYFNAMLSVGGTSVAAWQTSIGGHMMDSSINAGLPSNFYGIKVANPLDSSGNLLQGTVWAFSFESLRVPVWGDAYVQGNQSNYAYNPGFEGPEDFDPDGQVGADHIPVPDSMLLLIVPEVASVVTWALLGLIGICVNRAWSKRQG